MAGFKMDDYVDVAERVREFSAKYPHGSLQSEISFRDGGVLCKAYAYRGPEDERPGIGHAYEQIPGKTPYTKDSEVMNAETSAWGRAIVALGFETKKIASAQEVRNRQAPTQFQQPTVSTAAVDELVTKLAGLRGVDEDTIRPHLPENPVEALAKLRGWISRAERAKAGAAA